MRRFTLLMGCVLIGLIGGRCVDSQEPGNAQPSAEQLKKWLEEYPEADANHDGELTRSEAAGYRRTLQSRRDAQSRNNELDFRHEYTFATMSDGVQIALAIGYPRGFAEAQEGQGTSGLWPAILEMQGYPGSTIPQSPRDFGDRFVTVRASLRGAGASGGAIDAIGRQNGQDGYDVIEKWIVKQSWSNGKVALHGHSWGGLTAFMIAATNPPHLKAVAASGLFDDIYRDIGCPGGVRNAGFPVQWMTNLYHPEGPFESGAAARQARGLSLDAYQQLIAQRPAIDFTHSVLWRSIHATEDEPAFAAASPGSVASEVRVPIHIMHAYQDEQTGPSGAWLWKYIPDDVPKRLVMTNGDHSAVGRFSAERVAWLNYWTLDTADGAPAKDPYAFADRTKRVQVYFENPREGRLDVAPLTAEDFPLRQTRWTKYYLRAGQQLASEPATPQENGTDTYEVKSLVPFTQLSGVHYLLTPDKPLAFCGPVAVTFWAECSTVDTDFYVALADVDASGATQILQRGLLRASHRELDSGRTLNLRSGDEEVCVRPRHTHRNAQPLTPGKAEPFVVEVFPVGHVLRAGHQLALWISAPPLQDPATRHRDGRMAYEYVSAMPPSSVRILRGPEFPSHILLPVLPELPPLADRELPPGGQAGIFVE